MRETKCEVLESLLHFTPLAQPKLQLTVTATAPEQRRRLAACLGQNNHAHEPPFQTPALYGVVCPTSRVFSFTTPTKAQTI